MELLYYKRLGHKTTVIKNGISEGEKLDVFRSHFEREPTRNELKKMVATLQKSDQTIGLGEIQSDLKLLSGRVDILNSKID